MRKRKKNKETKVAINKDIWWKNIINMYWNYKMIDNINQENQLK